MRQLPLCILLLMATALPTRAAEQREKYDDGTLHFRVDLNAKGERSGTYTAFFPGGKKLQERSHYVSGKLSGVRAVFDEIGNLVREEAWVGGKLVAPKSPRLIEAARARILKESAASVLKMEPIGNPHAPSPEVLARALAKVNVYRYMADVPSDVVLDNNYINLCQYASELLVKLGRLDHNPPRPSGMDDESYNLGKEGCGRSNLFMGGDAIASVDAYMNDSDPSNIDRLGHRRWVLNPKMAKTGFGVAGRFSAMYSFDGSREDLPAHDFVCYPPRGCCPMTLFSPSWAWHISLNPQEYKVSDSAALAIYPVDANLTRASKPLDLENQHVDRGGFGIPNAIIARPKHFAMGRNVIYEVVVSGVETADRKAADISYYVSFY